MTDDIVARLREEGFITHMARLPRESKILHEAADEIERLRFERDGFLEGNRQTLRALAEANEIAKRYKAERDEARRWICKLLANPTIAEGLASPGRGTPRDFAEEQGWDCFNEAR